MPRRPRFTIQNGIYHVMIKGNNRSEIFHNDEDFEYYKELLADNKNKYRLLIYHYVLMDNHVHLIIKAADGKSLSSAIKRINVSYTVYYRKRYKGVGHFFQDRFKSCLIQEGKYLLECGKYVELNPVRAGMVKSVEEYRWSSYRAYANGKETAIVDKSPEYEGLTENDEQRKKLYADYINDTITSIKDGKSFRDGAYGSKEFIDGLREKGLKLFLSRAGRPKKSIQNGTIIIN